MSDLASDLSMQKAAIIADEPQKSVYTPATNGDMKMLRHFIVFLLLILITSSMAEENTARWNNFQFLIGDWKGEGSGAPGEGTGYFSFKFGLDKRILLRENHSEYPAGNKNSTVVHDDLMIIYAGSDGIADKAIYFDNEGHVINYSITFSDNKNLIFTSEGGTNMPVFRLTYAQINTDVVNIKFEISQDGENFKTYLEGQSTRKE